MPKTSLLMVAGLILMSSTPRMPAQDSAPFTLHVYTNLVQVPTLVVTRDLKPFPVLKRDQFGISLDQGPIFKPTQMRIEGDDPISLAILLDASGGVDGLIRSFGEALAKLAPQSLKPHDHVSIYAVDCEFVRSINDVPAAPDTLKAGVAAALASPGLHGTKQRGACRSTLRLWDTVLQISRTLGDLPGRRVLLVVSGGNDGKSTAAFDRVVGFAGSKSVAIFGLSGLDVFRVPGLSHDHFDQMCQSNGGFVQSASPREIPQTLQSFMTMLRGRYILEFPRPEQSAGGSHNISITVPGANSLALATGVTYATPDPSVLADPSTVHTAPSPAIFGHKP